MLLPDCTRDYRRLQPLRLEPVESFTVGEVNIGKCSFEVLRDGLHVGRVACGLNNLPVTGQTVRVRYRSTSRHGVLLCARLAR